MTDLDQDLARIRADIARQDLVVKWLLILAAAGLAVTVALTLDLLWRLP